MRSPVTAIRRSNFAVCSWLLAFSVSLALGERPAMRDYSGQKIIRAKVASDAQIDALEASGVDILDCAYGPGPLDLLVTNEQLALVQRMALPFQVLQDDVNGWVARERSAPAIASGDAFTDFFLSYHEYGDFATEGTILWYMNELVTRYPNFASLVEVGTALEGRTIWGLRITNDAVTDKPAVVYFGTEHAREWIASMIPPYFARHLLESYANNADVRDLVDNVEFFIIPVFNVDGYVYTWSTDRFWRKNRRPNGGGVYGVDLNRNWGKGWGGPGSSAAWNNNTYRGTAAFSEPETQALRDFFLAHPNIRAQLDLHSYAQLILWSNGYTNLYSPEETLLSQIGAAMRTLIYTVHAKIYDAGATYATLYPASGVSFDWTYYELGILSMTIECRDLGAYGFQLPASQIIPQGEELVPALLYYANTPWVRAGAPEPTVSAAGSRYLSITAAASSADVAFRVTSPDEPCLLDHVTSDGFLAVGTTSMPGSDWGTIAVGDAHILPQTTYHVQAVYAGVGPTHPVSVTTGMLGDVAVPLGLVDFRDIRAIVRAFQGHEDAPPTASCDLLPAVPDGVIDMTDVTRAVDTFRGVRSPLSSPCP